MFIWMVVIGTVVTLIVIYLVKQSKNTNPNPSYQNNHPTHTAPRSQSSSHGFTMAQINAMSSADRKDVAEAIGCDPYNLSSIENLAISTILLEKTIKLSATDSYLCKTTLCSCDTTIFTLFIVRALSIYACPTEEKAHWFDDYYVSLVIRGINYRYGDSFQDIFDMMDNRTEFYDRIFMSKPSFDEKLEAVFEEFEYVIKTDIIQKKYVPFNETSPLPILGMPDDHACQVQISNFCHNILRFLAPYYKETMDDMNV